MKSHEIKRGSGPCQITPTLAKMDASQAEAATEHVQNCPDCLAEVERLNSNSGIGGFLASEAKDIAVGAGLLAALGVFLSCKAVTNRIFVDRDSAEERNPMLKENE